MFGVFLCPPLSRLSVKLIDKKNPAKRQDLFITLRIAVAIPRVLLNFSFFINHVLLNSGIVLFDLHLLRHIALVLVGSIKVPSTCTGY